MVEGSSVSHLLFYVLFCSATPTACGQHIIELPLPDDWGPVLLETIHVHHTDRVQVARGAARGREGVCATLV